MLLSARREPRPQHQPREARRDHLGNPERSRKGRERQDPVIVHEPAQARQAGHERHAARVDLQRLAGLDIDEDGEREGAAGELDELAHGHRQRRRLGRVRPR